MEKLDDGTIVRVLCDQQRMTMLEVAELQGKVSLIIDLMEMILVRVHALEAGEDEVEH
jgi:hypothetical protein